VKRHVTCPGRPVASLIACSVAALIRSWKVSKRSQVIAVSKVSEMMARGVIFSRP
jgi:antitoxin (DNA-binding transcriptional repressor) of toxin-antitoxin stability system